MATDGRIRLLRILAVAVFLLVGGRAIALASSAGELTSIVAGQQQSTHTLPAHRGTIYDRDGHELAVGEARQTVYATPYLIEDAYAVAGDLCRVLKIRSKTEQQRIVEGALRPRQRLRLRRPQGRPRQGCPGGQARASPASAATRRRSASTRCTASPPR